MTEPLTELKIRARLLLNARRQAEPDLRLRDCLGRVARDVGFAHWEHARLVLDAMAPPGSDMGTFWHAPRCDGLLNPWFASLAEARAALGSAGEPGRAGRRPVLLPFRRQFVLAGAEYLRELGLDPDDEAWRDARHDLVQAYGGAAWRALAARRLRAPRTTFAAAR